MTASALSAQTRGPRHGALDEYEWQLALPAHLGNDQDAWLEELSAMRGRIIFDNGLRPSFRRPNGTFADPDPVDAAAFHVTARFAGKLAGCARLLKFADARTHWTHSLLGNGTLDRILADFGSSTELAGESGRWIVDPEHRCGQVGPYLMAGVYAVGRWLGLKTILGWSGTHQKQDKAFSSMGWQPVAGFALFPAPQFEDELRLMYFDLAHMRRVESQRSTVMAQLLDLR
jgi:hypothetical protein